MLNGRAPSRLNQAPGHGLAASRWSSVNQSKTTLISAALAASLRLPRVGDLEITGVGGGGACLVKETPLVLPQRRIGSIEHR